MKLKELTLADKPWVDELLAARPYLSCDYCFGNLFIWKCAFREQIARIGDCFTVLFHGDEGEEGPAFLYPAGAGPIKPVIEELLDHCEREGIPFRLHSAPETAVEELSRLFPGLFDFDADRDYTDYIYRTEDLVNLAGKRYHGQRNHSARFKEGDWAFEPLGAENMADCRAMNELWCRASGCGPDAEGRAEQCAVERAFRYYDELGFFGGLLRREGRVVAFTMGERLNPDTMVVHIEKALPEVQGAYPTINREFAARFCQGYSYINREEDLGIEGLRKAKLSYHPAILLPKYGVRRKDEAGISKNASQGYSRPAESVGDCLCR